jgi:hypothetical protein
MLNDIGIKKIEDTSFHHNAITKLVKRVVDESLKT